jgi:hypothetical protein
MGYLKTHCNTKHNCPPQVICICGKILATWKRLVIHKAKHFPQSTKYKCAICSMSYQKQSTYDAHMQSKHGPGKKVHVCKQCNREFRTHGLLNKHERIHLPNEIKYSEICTICNKK